MSIAGSFIPELDHEMATTRSLLERVPDGKNDWKPHVKSTSLGELSSHIASLVSWIPIVLNEPELDLNPAGGKPLRTPNLPSASARVAVFDENVKNARAALGKMADDGIMDPWTLRSGEHVIATLPRAVVLRSVVMNHIVHHRGQLSVYLRLLDVPLPPIYGPTADTK